MFAAGVTSVAGLAACRGGEASAAKEAKPAPARVQAPPVDSPLSGRSATRVAGLARAAVAPADGRAALIAVPTADAAATVRVRVGDGPEVQEPVWRVRPVLEAARASGDHARMQSWLGEPIVWQATPATGPNESAAGEGVAIVALPAKSGIAAARIAIDDRTVPVRWLPPLSGTFDFAAPGGGSEPGNPWLLAALEPARRQPWSLWRARLASSRLGPIGASGREDLSPAASRDSIIERLGVQHTAVWSVALQRLATADRDVVRRMVIRLGGAVNFGDGVWAPVWTNWPGPDAADDGLSLLREDLLADDLPPRERAARARSWIDNLPVGAAWIIDDAGLRDSTSGATVTTLALANLSDVPAAASVSRDVRRGDEAGPPLEMRTIPPMSVVRVAVSGVVGGGGGEASDDSGASVFDVRVGPWSGRVGAICHAVPARPPGVAIGPLVHDLDMQQIAGSAGAGVGAPVRLPAAELATVGMLQRDVSTDGTSRWVVYIECARPVTNVEPSDDRGASDSVLVAMGPAAGGVQWRVTPDGAVNVLGGDRARNAAATVATRVSSEPGRWRCWLTLPVSVIEQGRWLRLAMAREVQVGERTERTAWPRPVAPWTETSEMPARLLIDLSAWGQ